MSPMTAIGRRSVCSMNLQISFIFYDVSKICGRKCYLIKGPRIKVPRIGGRGIFTCKTKSREGRLNHLLYQFGSKRRWGSGGLCRQRGNWVGTWCICDSMICLSAIFSPLSTFRNELFCTFIKVTKLFLALFCNMTNFFTAIALNFAQIPALWLTLCCIGNIWGTRMNFLLF